MTKMLLSVAALCSALTLTAAPAEARSCGERARIVERLQEAYGEQRTAAGLAANNGIVEVFTSAETGSWTIIVTLPTGQSCLVAAGENWEVGPSEIRKSGLPT